jgi:uncharacterized protein (TIGR00661 family)
MGSVSLTAMASELSSTDTIELSPAPSLTGGPIELQSNDRRDMRAMHVGQTPIFFGVQATGNGHIYRYRGISEGLRGMGWSVVSAAVGQEQFACSAGTNYWMRGLSFVVGTHGINLGKTVSGGLEDLPIYLRKVDRMCDMLEESNAPAVVCDYEPLTARAAVECRLPLVILDNQTSVFCRSRRSKRHHALVALARSFTALWYGIKSLHRSHRIVTVSLSPEVPGFTQQKVVPAPIRHDILGLEPIRGNHAVLYASFGAIPPELLMAASTTHQDLEIRVHVPQTPPEGTRLPPNVIVRQAPSPLFLEDVRTAGAIIAQAGFMTSAEAAFLGKPLAMVPLRGQFEQILNGFEFERLGIGKVFRDYGSDLMDWVRLHRNRPETDPNVVRWLGAGVDGAVTDLNECLKRVMEGYAGSQRIPKSVAGVQRVG